MPCSGSSKEISAKGSGPRSKTITKLVDRRELMRFVGLNGYKHALLLAPVFAGS